MFLINSILNYFQRSKESEGRKVTTFNDTYKLFSTYLLFGEYQTPKLFMVTSESIELVITEMGKRSFKFKPIFPFLICAFKDLKTNIFPLPYISLKSSNSNGFIYSYFLTLSIHLWFDFNIELDLTI